MSVDPEHTEEPSEVGPPESTPEPGEQPAESPEQPGEDEEAAEEGEPAEAEPVENEPPPTGEVLLSEQDAEKMGERLSRERTRHDNRLAEIMGASVSDLVPCELCQPVMQGFHFPATVEARTPRDDLHARLLALLQRPTAVDIKQDPNTHACPTCEGLGELLTGSNVVNNERHKCNQCKGYGFVPPPGEAPASNGAADVRLAPVGEHFEALVTDDTDAWNEPKLLPDGRENPNYGKMPQFKIQVPPWGTTAGLTPDHAVPVE